MKKSKLILVVLILVIAGFILAFVAVKITRNQKAVNVPQEKKKSLADEIKKEKIVSDSVEEKRDNTKTEKVENPDESVEDVDSMKKIEEDDASLDDREPEDDLYDIIEDPEVE